MKHPFEDAMQHAIKLAYCGQWKTAPNPKVGAVLVHNNNIVAEGFHESPGSQHAEVVCLNQAYKKNINIEKCTLVVTLEPCTHFGRTPPCVQTIIHKNIQHVVIGTHDPNLLAGGGARYLKQAGITVETGILEADCRELIADFIIWQTTKRPYVILKLAATLDGKIATRTGDSSWISSYKSRQSVHQSRASIGSVGGIILIGGNTLRKDNPKLTSRIANTTPQRQPQAVVITSTLPEEKNIFLFTDRAKDTIIYTTSETASTPYAKTLKKQGVTIHPVHEWRQNKKINLLSILEHLRLTTCCPYVYCEGGGKLGTALLSQNLVDELHIFLSPKILADNKAIPMFDGVKLTKLTDAFMMKLHNTHLYDTDIHLIFKPEKSICLQE